MVRNPMTKQNTPDFSPSYEELLNELTGINSRLTIENIALKITIEKMRNYQETPENTDNK